jgi:hypothetical protein
MIDYVYDIELYSNFFLLCAQNTKTKERISFEISQRKVETVKLVDWLSTNIRLFGFNCIAYDGKILQKLLEHTYLKGKDLIKVLKKHSDRLILDETYAKFSRKFTQKPNVDLFLLHHFDNDARRTSLKDLEFVFNMPNIQELPFDFTKPVSLKEMAILVDYCWNDIDATQILYNRSQEALSLRESLSNTYGVDMLSWNSPKIGEQSFAFKLAERIGPAKLQKKSPRKSIAIGDIIFPYVQFETVGFQKLLSYLKKKVITDTYKVFSELPFEELTEIEGHYNVYKTKGVQKNLNIVHDGFEFVFGTGGVHGCIDPGVYLVDDEHDIEDIDVSSYYPNLGIKNKLYPEHLGIEFCDVYGERYEERGIYPKGSVTNTSIKLELNGVYGKSNSKFSPFYDPKYTMAITINGQLLLTMLAEQLMKISQILQINTDGVTIRVHKSQKENVNAIIEWWQKLTQLTLESASYSKMVIKDVSNYLAVYTNNKVKRKGAAFKTLAELEMHENLSCVVVQEAISAYYISNTPPIQYLMQELENGLSKFYSKVKIQRDHKLVARYEDEDIPQQRVTRYLITNTGCSLIKIMPPIKVKERESEVEAGWKCTPCNNLTTMNLEELKQNLNLEYYLLQINKIIDGISNGRKKKKAAK